MMYRWVSNGMGLFGSWYCMFDGWFQLEIPAKSAEPCEVKETKGESLPPGWERHEGELPSLFLCVAALP